PQRKARKQVERASVRHKSAVAKHAAPSRRRTASAAALRRATTPALLRHRTRKNGSDGARAATKTPSIASDRLPRGREIVARLERAYPDAHCALHHRDALQLLIATILSAQCTDARVNMVTPALFAKYPDAEAFAEANLTELEEMIRSTGFYHNKAKNIIGCC